MSALARDKIVPEVSRLIRAMDSDAIVVWLGLDSERGLRTLMRSSISMVFARVP